MSTMRNAMVLVLAMGLGGCGDEGGDDVDCKMVSASKAIAPETRIGSLSGDQRAQLCDAVACLFGGYRMQLSCSNGPALTFASSRTQCLSQVTSNPRCQATVKDLMDCMGALKTNACVSTFLLDPRCEAGRDFECLTIRLRSSLEVTDSAPSFALP